MELVADENLIIIGCIGIDSRGKCKNYWLVWNWLRREISELLVSVVLVRGSLMIIG